MSPLELEARIAHLEAEMKYLKNLVVSSSAHSINWWEKIVGTFENSVAFDEAMELGKQYRQSLSTNLTEDE